MTPEFLNAYRAARRGRNSTRIVPAKVALNNARANLALMQEAVDSKKQAELQMKAALEIDSRRYAPGMIAAREAMDKAQREWRRAWNLTYPTRSIRGEAPAINRPFAIDGSAYHATLGSWMEKPDESFRFVGLSSDIVPDRDRTLGYYVDSFQSETARGVVYQMRPTREGFARFIPAIADPCNSAKDGSGPAIMLLGDIITADSRDEDSADEARKDAARRAMDCARIYADAAREYDTAWAAGSRYADESNDLQTIRAEVRGILQERRAAMHNPAVTDSGYFALCDAIRKRVADLLEDMHKRRRVMRELASGDHDSLFFYPGDKRLQNAFCEGAGIDKFPA